MKAWVYRHPHVPLVLMMLGWVSASHSVWESFAAQRWGWAAFYVVCLLTWSRGIRFWWGRT